MHQIFLLNNVEDKYHFLIDSVFKHFANDKYKHMLTDMDRENYGLYVLFESLLYSLGRLSSQLSSNSQIQSEFYFYLEHTKNIFPKFISHLNLLENIYKAHIDEHSINLCIEKFVQIYQQNKDESEISLFELSVKALVALDLILRNYSPLTYSILSEKETFDIQDVNTLNNLNINENRIKLLRTSLKYFRGFSLLRALLCLIISDSVLYEEAEKYLFEALYCLKKITSNSLMKIELTRLLLMRFVVVLIENNKNKYVIAVNGCLQQTPQYDNYLYLQTMVILSQRISTMHLKLSNFSESELVLQHRIKQILVNIFSYKSYNINMISIGQIFEISNSATRICFGSLIFHLSKVYIHDGKHCALGIKILQYLRKYIHVINTTHLSFELARGYYKNGRYKIADNIMEKEVFIRNNKCFSLEFIQLRVLIMINCKRFGDALKVLKDAIEQMFTKEQKAILHYLQGKILQSQCFDQLRVIYEDTQNNNVAIYKQVTDPLQAQKAFLISHRDIRNVHRMYSCLELGRTYSEIIMKYYALPKFVLNNEKYSAECIQPIFKWFGIKIFDDEHKAINEIIAHCLDEIKHPINKALELCLSEINDIVLLIDSFIALAEFEFLKGNNSTNEKSKQYWKQSKILFFSTYKDNDDWIFLQRIDRHSRLQIFDIFKRMIKLLICYDNTFIADNVEIFASYIALETFIVRNDIIQMDNDNQEKSKYSPKAYAEIKNDNNEYKEQNNETIKNGDEHTIFPLRQRYFSYLLDLEAEQKNNKPHIEQKRMKKEKCLDELSIMHSKIKTKFNVFSGVKAINIDSDRCLVQITKCISALNGQSDEHEINRKHRNLSTNELFIISLDSIVFIFHPHTFCKYAIRKQQNDFFNDKNIKSFSRIFENIQFVDEHVLNANDTENNNSSNLKSECIQELLICLDLENILSVLGAIYNEHQIIIASKERRRTLAIIDAIFVLIHPFCWKYPCISWLSSYCFGLFDLSIPFIFGVPNIASFDKIISSNKYGICDKAIIVDVDTNSLKKPQNAKHTLPLKMSYKLSSLLTDLSNNVFDGEIK